MKSFLSACVGCALGGLDYISDGSLCLPDRVIL